MVLTYQSTIKNYRNIIMHDQNLPQDIWIVFTGKTDLKILRFFKKGFKHCFIILRTPFGWATIDPLYLNTDINFYDDEDHKTSLPEWFSGQGCVVVHTQTMQPQYKIQMPGIYSCVESAKKIIGLNKFFILTPWQLYKYLNKKG